MPLSQTAFSALKAVVNWNTFGSRELLAILREYPTLVKHKTDQYGPLGFILIATEPRNQLPDGSSVLMKTDPFPEALLPSCRDFGREWRQHEFTQAELADAIQRILEAECAG
jgi:hypothetical protein